MAQNMFGDRSPPEQKSTDQSKTIVMLTLHDGTFD